MSGRAAAALLFVLAGCTTWPAGPRPSATLLASADRLAVQGDWAAAARAYDEFVARYPNDPAAPQAQASRHALARLLEAEAEIARLQRMLAEREGQVGRLRQDLERVTAEANRLRADLERLKRIDIQLERRR